ncbi:hypothetical protein [Oleiagrimonas sp. C23AA]|uniref:hypothetical protein n=1 Tax=Oleiagrimonas sp. C23AA TaxID=2719047 RepID=UPI001422B6F3|nr:hypothetical protein [Oleiagrimonas sp. C23AA]NII10186.1 hypothetical protein [Oleiagrimonas sp. C23AA]
MGELLQKAMHGVDPSAPGAAWQIFRNLMALVPWWPMIWLTVVSVLVGAWLGWRRGRLWEGVLWALLLGPLGWPVILARPSRGGASGGATMHRQRKE